MVRWVGKVKVVQLIINTVISDEGRFNIIILVRANVLI